MQTHKMQQSAQKFKPAIAKTENSKTANKYAGAQASNKNNANTKYAAEYKKYKPAIAN